MLLGKLDIKNVKMRFYDVKNITNPVEVHLIFDSDVDLIAFKLAYDANEL